MAPRLATHCASQLPWQQYWRLGSPQTFCTHWSASHPGVSEAQVVGVPSEKYGEEVMAWIRPRQGVTLDAATLEAFCRGKIATFKIPRYWKFVDAFPMTVTGKVQKFRMREMAIAELRLGTAAAVRTA